MTASRQLVLYSRQECHLCDQAQALIEQVISGSDWQLEKVDIDSDPKLTELYRYSIPVLARVEGAETTALNWPFPPSRIKDLLKD
ncbi:MAG: glutaredoxin family protein [Pseudomonadales bacterium]|nr:glutaredoxin family protein [Pseudomonadales bacterium]